MRRHNKPRRATKVFAYRGLLTCRKCGCLYTAELTKGRYVYYHCSRSKGPCDSAYIREETLDGLFADAVRAIQPERKALSSVIEKLRKRHEDESAYRKDTLTRLRGDKSRLEMKMEKAYNDRLEGQITDEWWKAKSPEWRKALHDTEATIARLEKGDSGEFKLGIDLIGLAGRAAEMFKVRSLNERRQLLNVMASNFFVEGKNIVPVYKKPFDLLAKGLICSKTLPGLNDTRTPAVTAFRDWLAGPEAPSSPLLGHAWRTA